MSPAWDLLVASLHVYLDKRRDPEVPVSRAAPGLPLQPTDGSWSWAWAGAMAAGVRGGDTCGMEGQRSTDVFAELRSAGENEGMAGTPLGVVSRAAVAGVSRVRRFDQAEEARFGDSRAETPGCAGPGWAPASRSEC